MTLKANNGTESLVGKFSQLEAGSSQPKWLAPIRKAGITSFADQGFPTLHDEDWRFTNVAPIAQLPFQRLPAQRLRSMVRKASCSTRRRSPSCPAIGSCS